MQEWTSDIRIEQARTTRQAQHWQQQIASEEARFSGLLVDLFERRSPVSINTESGRRLTGLIAELGSDFVAIQGRSQTSTYLRLNAITALEIDGSPHQIGSPSLRVVNSPRSLETIINELSVERALVRFATKNSTELRSATLTSAGIDVVTLEIAGPPIRTLFVATEQLTEIAVAA